MKVKQPLLYRRRLDPVLRWTLSVSIDRKTQKATVKYLRPEEDMFDTDLPGIESLQTLASLGEALRDAANLWLKQHKKAK